MAWKSNLMVVEELYMYNSDGGFVTLFYFSKKVSSTKKLASTWALIFICCAKVMPNCSFLIDHFKKSPTVPSLFKNYLNDMVVKTLT